MIYYAIRHKPTGAFLPAVKTRQGGTTWGDPLMPAQRPPRLFLTRNKASQCLSWWLKGAWCFEPIPSPGPDDPEYALRCHSRPNRKAEDMEVIELRLEENTP